VDRKRLRHIDVEANIRLIDVRWNITLLVKTNSPPPLLFIPSALPFDRPVAVRGGHPRQLCQSHSRQALLPPPSPLPPRYRFADSKFRYRAGWAFTSRLWFPFFNDNETDRSRRKEPKSCDKITRERRHVGRKRCRSSSPTASSLHC